MTLESRGMGPRIRRLRVERGLSQTDLVGPYYTAAYLSHLENEKRTPSNDVLAHIAGRLGVTVDYLLTGRDPNLDLHLQLEVDKAIAEMHSGELDTAADSLERVRNKARREGFPRTEAAALEGLGLILQRRGRYDEALVHLQHAEDLLTQDAPEARTGIVTARARCLFATNEIHHAIHVLETHLVELDRAGSPDPTALMQTYSALIGPYFEAGLRERAATIAEDANRLIARVQDPEHVACLNINRAQILLEQGHRAEAMRCLARAEDLFKQLGWRDSAMKAAIAQATAAVEAGDLDAAESGAQAALVELEVIPSKLDRVRVLGLLARVERLRKRPAEALTHLQAVGKLLGKRRSIEQAWRLREEGLCFTDIDDWDQAEALLRRSLAIYRHAKAPEQIATTAAYLGDVLLRLGRADEAADVYRVGLTEVEDLAV